MLLNSTVCVTLQAGQIAADNTAVACAQAVQAGTASCTAADQQAICQTACSQLQHCCQQMQHTALLEPSLDARSVPDQDNGQDSALYAQIDTDYGQDTLLTPTLPLEQQQQQQQQNHTPQQRLTFPHQQGATSQQSQRHPQQQLQQSSLDHQSFLQQHSGISTSSSSKQDVVSDLHTAQQGWQLLAQTCLVSAAALTALRQGVLPSHQAKLMLGCLVKLATPLQHGKARQAAMVAAAAVVNKWPTGVCCSQPLCIPAVVLSTSCTKLFYDCSQKRVCPSAILANPRAVFAKRCVL